MEQFTASIHSNFCLHSEVLLEKSPFDGRERKIYHSARRQHQKAAKE